jgi:hypothetical protein
MTGAAFEAFLARLYADERSLARFLADPGGEAARASLTDAETAAMLAVDRASLRLAADSFAHKRAHAPARRRPWWRRVLARCLANLA